MNKTVFLTGGAGRIGKYVLRKLLDRGCRVKVLVHKTAPEGIASDHLEIIQGDILDRDTFANAVQGCHFVCHLAAVFDLGSEVETDSENDYLFDHLIRGTYNVLEAARQAGTVDLFAYASSDAVFSAIYKQHDKPITEEIELTPRSGRFYAMAKATMENMGVNYYKTYGLPYTVIRVGWCFDHDEVLLSFRPAFWESMFAPGERERLYAIRPKEELLIAPLYESGDSVEVQLAHADDTAAGFVLALENHQQAANQIFNIAGDAPFKFLDCIEKVANGMGMPWEKVKLAGLGRYQISNEKARRLLGYEPQFNINRMIDLSLANDSGHR